MFDDTGLTELMHDGFEYNFLAGPEYFHDMEGQRAVLKQFQTYPRNLVQGAGQLVCGVFDIEFGMMAGAAFRETQPAQVVQLYEPIDSDITGGGVLYNGFALQPLVEG